MRRLFLSFLLPLLVFSAQGLEPAAPNSQRLGGSREKELNEARNAQPKLLRLSATVDGSGRIVFTRSGVRYEHKSWSKPTNFLFDGEPWDNLSATPSGWCELAATLDLSKAWIVKRQGRDSISMESTPDGFDLYLCDAPNGAAEYEVVIAIPRRR